MSTEPLPLRLLRMAVAVILGVIFVLGLAVWLAGCGGGRKSPRPTPAPVIPVTTQWGSLSVQWSCPGQTFDRSKIEADVARAYLRGEQQDPRVAGLSLTGAWALFGGETTPGLHGHHEWLGPDNRPRQGGSRIYLRCPPAASALAHELQHRFAHQLQVPCDKALIDHPGGWTLGCARIPGGSRIPEGGR